MTIGKGSRNPVEFFIRTSEMIDGNILFNSAFNRLKKVAGELDPSEKTEKAYE